MKSFIVVLFLVAVVAAAEQKGEKKGKQVREKDNENEGAKGKGSFKDQKCNLTMPTDVTMEDCCPDKPKSLSCIAGKTCFALCAGKNFTMPEKGRKGKKEGKREGPPEFDMCCIGKCAAQNYTTDGKLDADKIVTAITATVQNNQDKWNSAVRTIVDGCIANASKTLADMKDKSEKKSKNDTTTDQKKGPKHQCITEKILACDADVQTAIATEWCIKKKLFLNCPTKVESASCNSLFEYADKCHSFWHHHGGPKSKGNAEGKREGKPEGKPEKQQQEKGQEAKGKSTTKNIKAN